MRTISRNTLLVAILSLSSACRSRQLREWTPRDHDPDGGPVAAGAVGTDNDPLSAGRALFAAQCSSCHGTEGRGDGPMAAMFRPADLSDPTLQSARSDEDLANAITHGKGRMPAFPQLRPEAIPLLVRVIRSWRR
jgi:mono/diheme cytochrome c family protein